MLTIFLLFRVFLVEKAIVVIQAWISMMVLLVYRAQVVLKESPEWKAYQEVAEGLAIKVLLAFVALKALPELLVYPVLG